MTVEELDGFIYRRAQHIGYIRRFNRAADILRRDNEHHALIWMTLFSNPRSLRANAAAADAVDSAIRV